MSFSCTIKVGTKDVTEYGKGPIHYQLLGLGPNGDYATEAPYRVTDFREAVMKCAYGDRLKDAAQDCFRQLQAMARENLSSLKQEKHCESCTCHFEDKVPEGWSVEECQALLNIDAKTVTYVKGSW